MLEIAIISTSAVHLGIRYCKMSYLLQQKYLQCGIIMINWANNNRIEQLAVVPDQ